MEAMNCEPINPTPTGLTRLISDIELYPLP
jgi:hypothetical protein